MRLATPQCLPENAIIVFKFPVKLRLKNQNISECTTVHFECLTLNLISRRKMDDWMGKWTFLSVFSTFNCRGYIYLQFLEISTYCRSCDSY